MKQDIDDFSKFPYMIVISSVVIILIISLALIFSRFINRPIIEKTNPTRVINDPVDYSTPDILRNTPMDPVNPDRSNGGPLSTMPGTSIAPGEPPTKTEVAK
jgi:hypothetical protein